MSVTLLAVVLLSVGADDPSKGPRVSGQIEGYTLTYSNVESQRLADAALALLRTCSCSDNLRNPDDLKALRDGDHVHIVFRKALKIVVGDDTLEFTELTIKLPGRALWMRCGKDIWCCGKYDFRTSEILDKAIRKEKPEDKKK